MTDRRQLVSQMDKLSTLLRRYSFNARVFFNGDFCDTNHFREDGLTGHLHLVRRGPVVFTRDGADALRVDQPALVFYPRGTSHGLEVPAGASASLLCALIAFDAGCANPLASALPDCLYLPLNEVPSMRHTLDLLFAEAAQRAQGSEVILDRLCDVFMVQVLRHQFDSGRLDAGLLAGLADPQLAEVLDAIHQRPHEPWQLQSLAALSCMSRARFTEHFRKVVGMPPIEYLSRWRIGLACGQLRQGVPVKVVSAQAGYASPSAFTRAFTEQLGVSPRQWLKNGEKKGGAFRRPPSKGSEE